MAINLKMSDMRKSPKVKCIKIGVRSSLDNSILSNMGGSLYFLSMLGGPCMDMCLLVVCSLLASHHAFFIIPLVWVERQGRQLLPLPRWSLHAAMWVNSKLPCILQSSRQIVSSAFPLASSSRMAALNLNSWTGTDCMHMLQHCLLLTKCS